MLEFLENLIGSWSWSGVFADILLIVFITAMTYLLIGQFNLFIDRVRLGRGPWRQRVLNFAPVVRFAAFSALSLAIGSILFESSLVVLVLVLLSAVIALGAGSIDVARNLLSGAMISFQRPFKVGDRLRVGELEGEVVQIGLRSCILKAPDGCQLEVPNHTFLNSTITQRDLLAFGAPLQLTFPVAAGVDLASTRELAYRAACISKYASPRRPPKVHLWHDPETGRLQLKVEVLAFDADYEDHLRSEIVEMLSEFMPGFAQGEVGAKELNGQSGTFRKIQ
ncbi:MAG: hypothetical protein AUK47_26495 [Deltaproteobacteria bacterium CG2_30_63_29]|nr:MAG: hypothetical protein AUK47_26495 [Deltaproteobacteria bacterium CG2_30_63_29]